MSDTNWGALFVFVQKVVDEIRSNAPPPAPDGYVSAPDLLAELNAVLPAWQAAWKAHQGLATGLADILQRLADNGVPYAAMICNALLSTPGALAEMEKWLPTIEGVLMMMTPAPVGIQGGGDSSVFAGRR